MKENTRNRAKCRRLGKFEEKQVQRGLECTRRGNSRVLISHCCRNRPLLANMLATPLCFCEVKVRKIYIPYMRIVYAYNRKPCRYFMITAISRNFHRTCWPCCERPMLNIRHRIREPQHTTQWVQFSSFSCDLGSTWLGGKRQRKKIIEVHQHDMCMRVVRRRREKKAVISRFDQSNAYDRKLVYGVARLADWIIKWIVRVCEWRRTTTLCDDCVILLSFSPNPFATSMGSRLMWE